MSVTVLARLDRARWWAITEQPFYGSLAMRLHDVIDPHVDTAETDGRVIRWSPDYIESLDDEEVRFVLLHEALHPGMLHLWRLPANERGNRAGDYEINLILDGIPGIRMPKGGLLDRQYVDLACEEILARLPEDEDQGGGQGKPDPCGSFTSPAAPDSAGQPGAGEQSQTLRDDWQGAVIQAAQAAQALGVGDIPGDMARLLERLRHQSVDWRREMADFVRDAASERNDWSRSARRHAWQPVIYPRKRSDDIGMVVFARDTSGSVSDAICSQYSALINDCVAELGCRGLVIDCDTRIQAETEVNDYQPCPLVAHGGGGTDFRPVFDRAAELVAGGEQIAGVVYLTDLCGPAPESCDIPTLWLATSDRTGPFGRTVPIES